MPSAVTGSFQVVLYTPLLTLTIPLSCPNFQDNMRFDPVASFPPFRVLMEFVIMVSLKVLLKNVFVPQL